VYIYLREEEYSFVKVLERFSHLERIQFLKDKKPILTKEELGSYMLNYNRLRIEKLPCLNNIPVFIKNNDVFIKDALSGVIFSNNYKIDKNFKSQMMYWNKCESLDKLNDERIVYYQNPTFRYHIDIPSNNTDDGYFEKSNTSQDVLLSEGIPVNLFGLAEKLMKTPIQEYNDAFVNVKLTLDGDLFLHNSLNEKFDRLKDFNPTTKNLCKILCGSKRNSVILNFYLKISDILKCPNPNDIWIDLLRYEMIDYGYFY